MKVVFWSVFLLAVAASAQRHGQVGTPGSVLFVAPDGTLGEDNDKFFWDYNVRSLMLGSKRASGRRPLLHLQQDGVDITQGDRSTIYLRADVTGGDGTTTRKYRFFDVVTNYNGNSNLDLFAFTLNHNGSREAGGTIGGIFSSYGGSGFGAHYRVRDQTAAGVGTMAAHLLPFVGTVDKHNRGNGKLGGAFWAESAGPVPADFGYGFWGGNFNYGLDFVNTLIPLYLSGDAIRVPNGSGISSQSSDGTRDVPLILLDSSNTIRIGRAGHNVRLGGTIQLANAGAKPACDDQSRFQFWVQPGGPTGTDTVEICVKGGSGYVWKPLF